MMPSLNQRNLLDRVKALCIKLGKGKKARKVRAKSKYCNREQSNKYERGRRWRKNETLRVGVAAVVSHVLPSVPLLCSLSD